MKLKELLCFALLCFAFTIPGCSTVGSQESKNSEKLLTEETQPDQRDYSDLESEGPSDSTKDNLPETDTAGSSQTAPEPGKAQEAVRKRTITQTLPTERNSKTAPKAFPRKALRTADSIRTAPPIPPVK